MAIHMSGGNIGSCAGERLSSPVHVRIIDTDATRMSRIKPKTDSSCMQAIQEREFTNWPSLNCRFSTLAHHVSFSCDEHELLLLYILACVFLVVVINF